MKYVYEYLSYKAYLNGYLASQPKKGHGLKSVWARELGCQSAYVSQVLNQQAHFSVEQVDELTRLLSLSEDEGHFLLLLVQLERAGTHSLKSRLKTQIKEILQQRELLRNRVDIKDRLSEEAQVRYYSSWHYAALHMAVTVDRLKTKQALVDHFKININRVTEVLDFLESFNLIHNENQIYESGSSRIFLGSDSDLISKHHTNWRIKAIESFDNSIGQPIHLSTVITLSTSDLKKVREELLTAIDRARSLVKETKDEEEIVCLNLDLFKL